MTATEERPGLHVPARVIPVPTSISPEAQAFLAMGPMPAPENPALDDIEGWRAMIAATNQMVLAAFDRAGLTSPDGFDVDEISVEGTTVYVITPSDLAPDDHRVYLEPHGGAFIVGGGRGVPGHGHHDR